jgi:hypothetical protein
MLDTATISSPWPVAPSSLPAPSHKSFASHRGALVGISDTELDGGVVAVDAGAKPADVAGPLVDDPGEALRDWSEHAPASAKQQKAR